MVGVAITTSSIAVGARCPWAQSGVGAVATQNVTLPSIGADTLARMAGSEPPQAAMNAVLAEDAFADYRQVIAISAIGETAMFAGTKMLGTNAIAKGEDCVAGGNLLADEKLPAVMTSAFAANADLSLPERLLRALEAGLQDGGGEMGEVRSAALVVADDAPWHLVNLRTDWDDAPVGALRRLWQNYEPQMHDYVLRARDPRRAPRYGVPGDE